MSGKKGMKRYAKEIREAVVARLQEGETQRALSKEYGISRYAIQSWLKEPALPKKRGRKPAKTLAEYKNENKRLKMENDLLRDFLQSVERK
ncbi:MAG: transposase [Clostridia bacterium]|nr:transposase [Clostridia bacterium]